METTNIKGENKEDIVLKVGCCKSFRTAVFNIAESIWEEVNSCKALLDLTAVVFGTAFQWRVNFRLGRGEEVKIVTISFF